MRGEQIRSQYLTMSLFIQSYGSEEELLRFLKGLFNREGAGEIDEGLLHKEWRLIEAWVSEHMVGAPSWDYALMDWPTDITLFNIAIQNMALQPSFTIEGIQELLSSMTLGWVVRIEWEDRIQDGKMFGGEKVKDCIVIRDEVHVWVPSTQQSEG